MHLSSRYPLELIARSAGRQLACVLLKRGRYILGQDPKHEIQVDEPSVSGRHARLTVVSDTEMLLEDLGSANGTFVDGHLADTPTPVGLTSLVQLGSVTLDFQRAGLPAAVFEYLQPTFLHPRRHALGDPVAWGGTSTIHEALDLTLGRRIAVRTMQPASQCSPVTVIRFVREAQIMAQLQHPGIPPVYDMRVDDAGQLLYTTRLLQAESLASIIERLRCGDADAVRVWTLPRLLAVWQKACDAVAFAHSRGIMHCALRPENVVAGAYGEVLVIGWTFAAAVPDECTAVESPEMRVQAPGEAITPAVHPCTAPEQVIGMGIYDERVDVYGFGAILYSLLAWEVPFAEVDEVRLPHDIIAGGIQPPALRQNPGENGAGERLREGLLTIALRALSTSPESRQGSVLQLQAEVAEWQSGSGAGPGKGRWSGLTGLLPKL